MLETENLSLNSPLSNSITNLAVMNMENRLSAQPECCTDTVFNYGDHCSAGILSENTLLVSTAGLAVENTPALQTIQVTHLKSFSDYTTYIRKPSQRDF